MTRLTDLAARIPVLGRLREQRNRLAAEVVELRRALTTCQTESADQRTRIEELSAKEAAAKTEARRLTDQLAESRALVDELRPSEPAYGLFPPGHFYSPIPDLPRVRATAEELFDRTQDVPDVNLRFEEQLELLGQLRAAIARWPYGSVASGPRAPRFQPDNGYFGWTDSQLYYAMLALFRPKKVLEIGSGWSTALLLDACEREGLDTSVVAVEPNPERLLSTLREGDPDRVRLLTELAQDLPPAQLADLGPGDVLFIDSTHVSKLGSDVNHLVFRVFPLLPAGVLVHVHDIAYPFEYPKDWVEEGRAWNEAYLLRAFLMNNERWRILLWPSLLWLRAPDQIRAALHPATLVDGGSLWLQTG